MFKISTQSKLNILHLPTEQSTIASNLGSSRDNTNASLLRLPYKVVLKHIKIGLQYLAASPIFPLCWTGGRAIFRKGVA